jgi:hypothetical protein
MRKLLLVILAVGGLAAGSLCSAADKGKSPAPARLGEPEVVGKIPLADVAPGMRVRLQLAAGRPFVGTVLKVSDTMLELGLSTEASGLPGKVRFRKSDITAVTELKKQSDEEKRLVIEQRQKSVAQIRIEAASRLEKRRAEETTEEAGEKTAQEEYRKALDVAVSKQKEDEMRALLAEFPPPDWGEGKFREIRENWILRDLRPTEKEVRFLSVFKDWKEARDTVAILDAKEQEKEGEKLLLKFPPSEGWGQATLAAIAQKEAAGEPVTEKETEFKKSYEAWSQAVLRRAEAKPAAGTAAQGEEEKPPATPEPVEPAKPAEEKPAATPPAEEKAPAEDKPAVEKAPVEEKAPDEVKPPAGDKAPADEPPPAGEKPAADDKTPPDQKPPAETNR